MGETLSNEYLCSVLNRWPTQHAYSEQVSNNVRNILREFNYQFKLYKSGSQAKGTELLGGSDFDYLLSIDDFQDSLRNLYNETYSYLSQKLGAGNVKKQNVSIMVH